MSFSNWLSKPAEFTTFPLHRIVTAVSIAERVLTTLQAWDERARFTPRTVLLTPCLHPCRNESECQGPHPPRWCVILVRRLYFANAYHLYLQPGSDIVDEAGGVGSLNWGGLTYTDSGGFQVLSLGAGV